MKLDRVLYSARTFSWMADPRRFLPLAETPIDRPIFLLGTQGGGLTLLSRMLRRHPATISAAGGPGYWTSADELQNVYGPILPFELTGLRYKAPPHPTLSPPRSWTYAARDLYPKYRKRASDATPELRRALERVIRLSAHRHARNRLECRFVDKSQVFTVRVGLVQALLADHGPRFVLVPREPYVSIFRAATGKAGDMRRLAEAIPYAERIDICAEHYGNSMRAVFEDVEELGLDLHVARYEDLVREPEAVLRDVCRFVELEYRTDMLPGPGQKLPLGSRFSDRWYPLKTDANEPYEGRIDQATIDATERHVGDLVERLGYRRRRSAVC